jgi:hypothetical protein
VVGVFLVASFFVKPFFGARAISRSALCQARLRHLSNALTLYAQDWSDTLPPAARWGDLSSGYLSADVRESAFSCPSAHSAYGFAFNERLDKGSLHRIEPETVMLLEADAAIRNAVGNHHSLAHPRRHFGTTNVALADGRVKRANAYVEARLVWGVGGSPEEEHGSPEASKVRGE